MAKDNLISNLQNQGFVITSDPTWFNPWGYRNLWSYGAWVDSYSNGYHRAYDLAKYHNAPIKSGVNGTVLQGTGFGGFGYQLVLGFIASNGKKYQIIYGHLNRNPLLDFKVGQNVKKGQVVAYQGASNNLGVTMASHLHIQVQHYQYYNEYNFIVNGINPLNIDISSTKPSSGATPTKKPATPASKPSAVNKNTNRSRSLKAHFSGRVDSLGAEVRKRRGSRRTGFNWNQKAGYSLKPGDLVYIFEVHDGWGRIYTGNLTGHGSNDWIWLGRLNV